MAKRNKKKRSNRYYDYEDYEDIRGKGTRKEKRKAKRHYDKKILDKVARGDIILEDYDDYIDGSF